ncbi:hypothetical protein NG798_04375 [Ancylothrix sp. C2]|uniref:hypothetical protein n=1 Tax=Ancylothrix sp. D3o TaxID=2953691 RepID=UPI0021BB4B40|nr:hypothetical protein [Ancylothrix sp. D3o]MCT7949014.1 hypothetical protein [Ancylothrix sp. D3o]
MSDPDKLILTIYVIVVTWILYQSINSLGEQIYVKFDRDSYNQQLQEQNLQNLIEIKFNLKPRYEINQFREIEIEIKNNFPDQDVYIDWESSCLIDVDRRSQRLVRLSPGMKVDIFVPQVKSLIAPGRIIAEKFTAEKALKRDTTTDSFEATLPLVPSARLKSQPVNRPAAAATLVLRLALQVSAPLKGAGVKQFYVLSCPLNVTRLDWMAALPWMSKK